MSAGTISSFQLTLEIQVLDSSIPPVEVEIVDLLEEDHLFHHQLEEDHLLRRQLEEKGRRLYRQLEEKGHRLRRQLEEKGHRLRRQFSIAL